MYTDIEKAAISYCKSKGKKVDGYARMAFEAGASFNQSRISQLEYELSELTRNYSSDKKHYAVIEKSNADYVKIIDKHIESGDNKNFKALCAQLEADLAKSQEKCKAYEGALERILAYESGLNFQHKHEGTINIAEQALKPKEDD